MPDNSPSSTGSSGNPTFAARFIRYTVRVVIFVLVVLVVGIYAWKVLAVKSLERKLEVERSEMMVAQRRALNDQARQMLQLTALPLAWAVRTELMRDNLDQVDDYFRDLIREQGVLLIALIGKEGKVALATDRKLETQSAEDLFSKAIRDANTIVIEDSDPVLRVGIPILSLNEKLGILVMDYRLQNLQAPAPQP